MFPSPFGVRFLKFFLYCQWYSEMFVVSVPFRGSLSKITNNSIIFVSVLIMFPSPFGVRFLKFVNIVLQVAVIVVSVPFRGSLSKIISTSGRRASS